MTKQSAIESLFRSRAGQWVSALALMRVGGALSWRTRVSDARRLSGMHIEWRWRVHPRHGRVSEYRYQP